MKWNKELKKVISDTYGEYNVRCIGVVRHMEIMKYFREKKDNTGYQNWIDKYSPFMFFKNYSVSWEVMENEKLKPYMELHDLYDVKIFVATIEDNKEWNCEKTKYYNEIKGKKNHITLPVVVPQELIETWQNSLPPKLLGLADH